MSRIAASEGRCFGAFGTGVDVGEQNRGPKDYDSRADMSGLTTEALANLPGFRNDRSGEEREEERA